MQTHFPVPIFRGSSLCKLSINHKLEKTMKNNQPTKIVRLGLNSKKWSKVHWESNFLTQKHLKLTQNRPNFNFALICVMFVASMKYEPGLK